jgi:hypothetical protein
MKCTRSVQHTFAQLRPNACQRMQLYHLRFCPSTRICQAHSRTDTHAHLLCQVASSIAAVVHINNTPVALQPLSVSTTIACGTAIVDVGHSKACRSKAKNRNKSGKQQEWRQTDDKSLQRMTGVQTRRATGQAAAMPSAL